MPGMPLLVHHAPDGNPAGRAARHMAATGAALAHAPESLPTLRLRLPRHARPLPRVRYNPNLMKRLCRILVYAVTGLSGMLCAGTCILWVRSYAWADHLECWSHPGSPGRVSVEQRLLWSQRGCVGDHFGQGPASPATNPPSSESKPKPATAQANPPPSRSTTRRTHGPSVKWSVAPARPDARPRGWRSATRGGGILLRRLWLHI
jgi:hypothetical protein